MLRTTVLITAALLFATTGRPPIATAHDHDHHGSPAHSDIIESVKSGPWSSAETWGGGKVPAAGAKVLIKEGHQVLYDADSEVVIRAITISGMLRFADDRNTRLEVGLIRIESGNEYSEEGFDCLHSPGEAADAEGPGPIDSDVTLLTSSSGPALIVGTPQHPIPAEHLAVVRLHYLEGMDAKSCPAIVCCGGRMDLHGSPLERTWVKLPYQTAKVGESRVVLPYPLPGWKVGDRIILTGTTRQFGYLGTRYNVGQGEDNSVADSPTTEERVITGMRRWGQFDSDLQIVSFEEPLKFEHTVSGDYRAEVANLSRNVVIESADPDGNRGHTMYQADSTGSISYAEFRHLGKRDTLGKYPIHYHLVGDTMRGSSVIGASIWDSHNRWVTIHGTQYLVVRDCVGYQSVGHGYFLEDGTEVYNVLDRNLAVQALDGDPLPEQVLPYDQNLGSGFWWANSLNTFTKNCAVECDEDGFRFETVETDEFNPHLPILQPDGTLERVDIRTLPFVRFDGNEAHCQRLFAFNLGGFARGRHASEDADVEGVGPDYRHPFVVRNMKLWNSHWGFHCGSPCVILDGVDFHDCAYGLWRCVMHRHEHRRLTFSDVPTPLFFPRAMGEADYDYSISDYFDLEPVDDLPPATIITHVQPSGPQSVVVRGTTTDNYDVTSVVVNNRSVRAIDENFAQWEVELTTDPAQPLTLTALAEDAKGNVEQMHHVLRWSPESSPSDESESRPKSEVTSTAAPVRESR